MCEQEALRKRQRKHIRVLTAVAPVKTLYCCILTMRAAFPKKYDSYLLTFKNSCVLDYSRVHVHLPFRKEYQNDVRKE